MSREEIDKAIYDPERYESLRDRGVGEERAKRVATVPLNKEATPRAGRGQPDAPRKPLAKEIAQQQTYRRRSDPPPSAPGLGVSADPDL